MPDTLYDAITAGDPKKVKKLCSKATASGTSFSEKTPLQQLIETAYRHRCDKDFNLANYTTIANTILKNKGKLTPDLDQDTIQKLFRECLEIGLVSVALHLAALLTGLEPGLMVVIAAHASLPVAKVVFNKFQTQWLTFASTQLPLEKVKADPRISIVNLHDEQYKTPLHHAVERDDIVLCKRLIKAGANVDALDDEFQTPLHKCAKRNKPQSEKIAALLILAGANVDLKDKNINTPGHLAIESHNHLVFKLLLQNKANPYLTSSPSVSPPPNLFRQSAISNNPEIKKVYSHYHNNFFEGEHHSQLKAMVNSSERRQMHYQKIKSSLPENQKVITLINSAYQSFATTQKVCEETWLRDVTHPTLLRYANNKYYRSKSCRYLKKGIGLPQDLPSEELLELLFRSIEANLPEQTLKILDHRALPLELHYVDDVFSPFYQKHLLMFAATYATGEVVKKIYEKWFSHQPLLTETEQDTPYHAACKNRLYADSVIKVLHEIGLDINLANAVQETPLHTAVCEKNPSALKTLLIQGADHGRRDGYGRTALHYAVTTDMPELITILGKNKADPNLSDNFGKTPLHYAANNPHTVSSQGNTIITGDAINALMPFNPALNAQDGEGNTALHLCFNNNWFESIALYNTLIKSRPNPYIKNHQGHSFAETLANDWTSDEQIAFRNNVVQKYLKDNPPETFPTYLPHSPILLTKPAYDSVVDRTGLEARKATLYQAKQNAERTIYLRQQQLNLLLSQLSNMPAKLRDQTLLLCYELNLQILEISQTMIVNSQEYRTLSTQLNSNSRHFFDHEDFNRHLLTSQKKIQQDKVAAEQTKQKLTDTQKQYNLAQNRYRLNYPNEPVRGMRTTEEVLDGYVYSTASAPPQPTS